jgi:hypothetical protein
LNNKALRKGDENTKFFQAYAKGRNMKNTIWRLIDDVGRNLSSFEELANLEVQHFKSFFNEEERVSIDVVIQLAL